METKKIVTPARINLAFITLLILPLIFAFWIYKASATVPIDNTICDRVQIK